MNIRKAKLSDLQTILNITKSTISVIYPHYYPVGAVEFFLNHHSENNIVQDIEQKNIFLGTDNEQTVGTVTVKGNEICRLFVLPHYQGKGYGKELLNFAENLIAECYSEIRLDSSLSAKGMYVNRGYKEIEYHKVRTENGDFLCYDVMIKIV